MGYDEDETYENIPTVQIDGEDMSSHISDGYDLERVQVSFPDAENGYQTEAQEAMPLGWCNNAAITLDRESDAVHLTISVGDPRGAFHITVRRLANGELIMHLPHPSDSWLHMPLTELHAGTYKIS